MYAIYGSSSPVMVQPPSLDEYLQFQAWREEKRQYQLYQERRLQIERQRQRQRVAAAMEQQRQVEERQRKQQRQHLLNQRQMMAYLEHIRQQQELKQQQERMIQQQQVKEQEMARQKLMQQLYWQSRQEEGQEQGADGMDWSELVEGLMTRLLHGDAVYTNDDDDLTTVEMKKEVQQDHHADHYADEDIDSDSDSDSDSDELLMVLTDDAFNDSVDTGKQQDTESDDSKLVTAMDDSAPKNNAVEPSIGDDDMDNNKKTLKLASLTKIKDQLDDIHTSHQRILASSLYFNDNDVQHHDDDTTIQIPTISKNHDFLQYEDNIMRILLQLDDISSEGDDMIRQKRKDLVKQAEFILDQLDQHKQSEWERHSSTTTSSVGSESDDSDDDNKDYPNDAAGLTDYFILNDPLANTTTHDDDDKASSVTSDNDNDNDMTYELMQDVDGDGFLILNL
ncbi:unnamed protein product [Absidia cylindrospora]